MTSSVSRSAALVTSTIDASTFFAKSMLMSDSSAGNALTLSTPSQTMMSASRASLPWASMILSIASS
jgi:hypothetical protein